MLPSKCINNCSTNTLGCLMGVIVIVNNRINESLGLQISSRRPNCFECHCNLLVSRVRDVIEN